MKFRKRPVVIDAMQFDGYNIDECKLVVLAPNNRDTHLRFGVITLEGEMEASPGDWIITGVHGERYPCKPDIFSETYERSKPEPKVCVWEEEDGGTWTTGCSYSFFFADTSPSENEMAYCCYCGGRIEERRNKSKPYTEEEH